MSGQAVSSFQRSLVVQSMIALLLMGDGGLGVVSPVAHNEKLSP